MLGGGVGRDTAAEKGCRVMEPLGSASAGNAIPGRRK